MEKESERVNPSAKERKGKGTILSLVVACYNEERTLETCIDAVLKIAQDDLDLEIIIVDDGSVDRSRAVAEALARRHPEVHLIVHERNRGKGAALRTGIKNATGDFVAIQDADLEYDPMDLRRLLEPLVSGEADVVLGSRFQSSGAHRVLYFWHYLGNRFLTFVSNMFTDLNLTDMETCYKVFRREIIQQIDLREDRFGFEPEVIAKVAQLRVRIYEMGITYRGRTYEEGKKISARDGFHALYCIAHYNLHRAPLPIQFAFYLLVEGVAALVNYLTFTLLYQGGYRVSFAALSAFVVAAAVNYFLCILLLFRHRARWNSVMEVLIYVLIVALTGAIDLGITAFLLQAHVRPGMSKLVATGVGLFLNFYGRRFWVFPEKSVGKWKPQEAA
jgi:dolichol-phosphate mannosyltransferase